LLVVAQFITDAFNFNDFRFDFDAMLLLCPEEGLNTRKKLFALQAYVKAVCNPDCEDNLWLHNLPTCVLVGLQVVL